MTAPKNGIDRRVLLAAGLGALAGAAWANGLEERGYALGDVALGAEDAPLTVIEYASFTCPHCANFHRDTWPAIRERYVDTGKVRFIFREVYFEQYGLWASMIARCGGEATFHGFVSAFLNRQNEWARSQDVVGELMRIGRLGGLPAERLQACLTDAEFMNRLVADYQANATEHNVRSTPTFVINGETHTGAMSVAQFSALLDRHL